MIFRPWFHRPVVWLGAAVLVAGGLFSINPARQTYRRWTQARLLQSAQTALTQGDYQKASLAARSALESNPQNLEALRVIAKAMEALESPLAIKVRRQMEALSPGDLENQLALAGDWLRAGNIAAAQQGLAGINPAPQENALYHDLAAGVAWGRQDWASAEEHWLAAIRLSPQDEGLKIKLATARLHSGAFEVRRQALEVLEHLRTQTATRLTVLRILVRDALEQQDYAKARGYAEELRASPEAAFSDQMAWLESLRGGQRAELALAVPTPTAPGEFFQALEELRESALNDKGNLAVLLSWMNEHSLAITILDWEQKGELPAAELVRAPLCLPMADALARTSAWKELRTRLEKQNWGGAEFLRLAFLARALEREGEQPAMMAAWTKALTAAEERPERLESLGKLALSWGWEEKVEGALRKLARQPDLPAWVPKYLWQAALKRGASASLYQAAKLVYQAEPASVSARNNFICLALLTNQTADSPHQMAEELYRKQPRDHAVATTYALSLLQRGRAREAVAALEGLQPAELKTPQTALYYGLSLIGLGEYGKAPEFLRLGERAPRLPEEKALSDYLLAAFRARREEDSGDRAKAQSSWEEAMEEASTRADCLETLADLARTWHRAETLDALLLKLLDQNRCPAWGGELLWDAARRTEIPNLIFKAGGLVAETNPKSAAAQNNWAVLSILSQRAGEAPYRKAEAAYQSNPENADALALQAFALYRKGRLEQSLVLISGLPADAGQTARTRMFRGILLAAEGRLAPAVQMFQSVAGRDLLPQERGLFELVQRAAEAQLADGTDAAKDAWASLLRSADRRGDWLEILAQMTLRWNQPAHAEDALWKLAEQPDCPRWAIDTLWKMAEASPDAARLRKASRLMLKEDPKNTHAQYISLLVNMLTKQDSDAFRQAEGFKLANPANPEAVSLFGLALHQRHRAQAALDEMTRLKPEALRQGRTAFYYGLFLQAVGDDSRADEYLRIGLETGLLPEEKALVASRR